MINQFINDIGGIGVFGTISICLFFLVFSGVLIFAFTQKKSAINAASALPLDDANISPVKGNQTHE